VCSGSIVSASSRDCAPLPPACWRRTPKCCRSRCSDRWRAGTRPPGSDADLLIIVRDGAGRFLDRSVPLAPYFDDVGVGCELFVYTESEASRLASSPSIVRTALEEGVRIGDPQA
jgi:hypothetical protein